MAINEYIKTRDLNSGLNAETSEEDKLVSKIGSINGIEFVTLTNLSGSKTALHEQGKAALSGTLGIPLLVSQTGSFGFLQLNSAGKLEVASTSELQVVTASEGGSHVAANTKGLILFAEQSGTFGPLELDSIGRLRTVGLTEISSLSASEGGSHVATNTKGLILFAEQSGTFGPLELDSIGRLRTVGLTELSFLSKSEDAQHTNGDTGIMPLAVRNDTQSSLASANGDYIPFTTDASGSLRVTDDTIGTVRAEYESPIDFSCAYVSNTIISMSGTPVTFDDTASHISYVFYKPTASTQWKKLVNGKSGVSFVCTNNAITGSGCGTPFASGDAYVVGVNYQRKAYSSSDNVMRIKEIASLDTKYENEELVDTTNVAASTVFYPSSAGEDVAGYRDISFTCYFEDADSNISASFEVTNDDAVSPDWFNGTMGLYDWITNAHNTANQWKAFSGSISLAVTANDFNFRKYRWRLELSSSHNAVQIHSNKKSI